MIFREIKNNLSLPCTLAKYYTIFSVWNSQFFKFVIYFISPKIPIIFSANRDLRKVEKGRFSLKFICVYIHLNSLENIWKIRINICIYKFSIYYFVYFWDKFYFILNNLWFAQNWEDICNSICNLYTYILCNIENIWRIKIHAHIRMQSA